MLGRKEARDPGGPRMCVSAPGDHSGRAHGAMGTVQWLTAENNGGTVAEDVGGYFATVPASIFYNRQNTEETENSSVLEDGFGEQQVLWREVMGSAPSDLMVGTLFRVRERQNQAKFQEL